MPLNFSFGKVAIPISVNVERIFFLFGSFIVAKAVCVEERWFELNLETITYLLSSEKLQALYQNSTQDTVDGGYWGEQQLVCVMHSTGRRGGWRRVITKEQAHLSVLGSISKYRNIFIFPTLYTKLMDVNLYVLECGHPLSSPDPRIFQWIFSMCRERFWTWPLWPLGTPWLGQLQGPAAHALGVTASLPSPGRVMLPLHHLFLYISRTRWHHFPDQRMAEFSSVLSVCCVVSSRRSP